MISSARDFWVFHAVFWLLAATALFLYGLTYGHAQVALVRNIYTPLVGFAFSYLIRAVYEHSFPTSFGKRLLLILSLSVLGALASALVVNPITFSLLGYDFREMPLRNLLQDGLYFVLLYVVWSLLYLQLSGKSLVAAPVAPTAYEAINVTKGNQVFRLDLVNITCIKASGDYVEICTANESYLKQGTISSYEEALRAGPFARIHRSVIVNRDKIASVEGPSKGQYLIALQDGQELRSSRKYQQVVAALMPEAT